MRWFRKKAVVPLKDILSVADLLQKIYMESGWSHLAFPTDEQAGAIKRIHQQSLAVLLLLPPELRGDYKSTK